MSLRLPDGRGSGSGHRLETSGWRDFWSAAHEGETAPIRDGISHRVQHEERTSGGNGDHPGASEGGPGNRHRGSDQWLYVVSGTGVAVVNRKRIFLRRGTILRIQRRDVHEVKNTGRAALKTINVYVPPAYTRRGDELPRAKP